MIPELPEQFELFFEEKFFSFTMKRQWTKNIQFPVIYFINSIPFNSSKSYVSSLHLDVLHGDLCFSIANNSNMGEEACILLEKMNGLWFKWSWMTR